MKQRVALARVLILQPQLLLMDEPFGALDAQTREDMQNLLLSFWEKFSHTIFFEICGVSCKQRAIIRDKHRPARTTTDMAHSMSVNIGERSILKSVSPPAKSGSCRE